jgi:hypothetical protein
MALAGLFAGLMAIVPLFLPPQMNSRNTLANPLFEDIHRLSVPDNAALEPVAQKASCAVSLCKPRRPQKVAHPHQIFPDGLLRTIEDMRRCLQLVLFWCLVSTGLHADGPAFDLAGPKVDVRVKRGEVTLPIGQVPTCCRETGSGFIPTFPRANPRIMS